MQTASFSVLSAIIMKTMPTEKEQCQYPSEAIIPMLYKFIYKYESLNVNVLSDKQIKDNVSKSTIKDFEAALSAIQKTGKFYNVRNNKEINSLFNVFQGGKEPEVGFHFEKRTKKATFLNSLLYHLRNTLSHAGFKEEGNYYKIIDYDDMRLSAFGYIEKSVFLQLLSAFTK